MENPKTTTDNWYLFWPRVGWWLKAVCNNEWKRLVVHTWKYYPMRTQWRIREDIQEDFWYLLNEEEKIVTDEEGNKLWIHTWIYYDQWTIWNEKDDIKEDNWYLYTNEDGNVPTP